MKRCPQCEFIYEDDQSLCDMDGVLLVLDTRTLPHPHALAPLPKRPVRRNRAVPAFATLILVLVLGLVYFVLTQRKTYTPAAAAVPVSIPTPEAQPSETPKEEPPKEEPKPEAKEAETKPTEATSVKKPVTKAATASQTTKPTATQQPPKKEDSKVNSILKKTGRILKKPFKF